MQVSDRLTSEKDFHDRQARQRAARFAHHQSDLTFEDATYLDHESWIRPAISQLGHLRGAQILDYGCGHGMA
ncbi:class I SAM-dependent methyltransferase, partial [Singulisphaera rosea]